ncbi:MAG: HAD-IIIA family hydrolase [Lachnospiraceae bacterium]|nr:HAD-IIIA family hydrolase [Lachnospiraceae bacterium]
MKALELTENVQVVVMMGGLGKRLGEYTADCPKPLVPVGGRPFFDYEFLLLRLAGFRRFVFCTGYRSGQIQETYGDGSLLGVEIQYSLDSPGGELLGTGGAVRKALPLLDPDFLLTYADSFMDIDYREVMYRYARAKKEGKKALMTLLKNQGRFDASNVIYEEGKLKLYDKARPVKEMQYIDYGVNVFERSLFEAYPEGERFDLSELQHRLSREGALEGLVVERRFYEIGSPDSYREFIEYAKNRFDVKKPAVFLDRDGVLNEIVFNEETEQLDSPLSREELKLLDGVGEAVRKLREKGFYLFIVTNQPAAAKGKTTLGRLYEVNAELRQRLSPDGEDRIDEVFMCPHYPKESPRTKESFLIQSCDCRKPKAGLIRSACQKYGIDLEHSYMVGDSYTDIACGREAGLQTVFIGNYKCDACARLEYRKPDRIVSSLLEFAEEL